MVLDCLCKEQMKMLVYVVRMIQMQERMTADAEK